MGNVISKDSANIAFTKTEKWQPLIIVDGTLCSSFLPEHLTN